MKSFNMLAKGNRLKEWRESHEMSQQDVADLTGVTVAMVSLLERGERDLSALGKVRFCRLLGLPVRELFPVKPNPDEKVCVAR